MTLRARWSALALVTWVGAACAGSPPATLGPQDGWLAPCPGTPNCVHTGDRDPDGTEGMWLDTGVPNAFQQVVRIVEEMPRTRVVRTTDSYLHAEERSRLFRFVDDVEVLLTTDGQLVVRSASRLGKGDMGVNARRVARLRALLTEAGLLRPAP